MTLATFTLALALSATHAQVPPAPPAVPALPAVPSVPVMPAMPAIPPMPLIPDMPVIADLPDFDFPHFEMPDFDVPHFEMPDVGALLAGVDLDAAMIAAETAMASMPPLASMPSMAGFEGHLAAAESALAGAALSWEGQARGVSRDRENSAYERARAALDRRNWDDAVERFDVVVSLKGDRADAALYWKAYAQSRAGRAAEAQATIAALRSGYPKSRYLNDANALEVELKRGGGQQVSPEAQQDEDLKLLAIQGLQHSAPEQAIPLLEKILGSSNSPRVKERALYVLALSNSPRAREILLGIAKGAGNPDLQRKAIDYLATHTGGEGRAMLEDIYRTNGDQDVRRRVLRAYMANGDKARLLAVAQNEQNEELRVAAIRYLGSSGGGAELASLYEKESSPEVRAQIVRGLGMSGSADRLRQVVRNEKDPEVRVQAIRAFMMVGREKTGTALRDMYATESTPEGKRAIVQALHAQDDADGLVALARVEKDPKQKEYIVRRLSTMTKSKVALDYLMELLNK